MAQIAAATNTLIYTCPASTLATKNVCFCNTGSAAATIRLFKGTGTNPTTGDELIYGQSIAASASIERTQLHLEAGDKLWAWVSDAAVMVNNYGPAEAV